MDEDDILTPVSRGAGCYRFLDADKNIRLNVTGVKSFEELENGIKVCYSCDADCKYLRKIYTAYTFKEDGIGVEACIDAEGFEPQLMREYCFFVRQPLNPCNEYQKRMAYY